MQATRVLEHTDLQEPDLDRNTRYRSIGNSGQELDRLDRS